MEAEVLEQQDLPLARSATSLRTPSPTQSSAKITSRPRSCERRRADVLQRQLGHELPVGRPRCEARMTFAFLPIA